MHQNEYKAWLNSIVSSVEELEQSYKRRIELMNIEYQKDINDLLDAYKHEKQQLSQQIAVAQEQLLQAKAELSDAIRRFKNERFAHKVTKDNFQNAAGHNQ